MSYEYDYDEGYEEEYDDSDMDISDLLMFTDEADKEVEDEDTEPEQPIVSSSQESVQPEIQTITEDDDYSDLEFYDDEEEEGEEGISYEEQMVILANDIFKSVLSFEEGWKEQLDIFKTYLSPELFRNENYMVAVILTKYIKDKLINPRLLGIRLNREIGDIAKLAGIYVDMENYSDESGAKERGYIEAVLDQYEEYSKGHIMNTSDFLASVEAYKSLYEQVELIKVLQTGIEMATTGVGKGRSRKMGPVETMSYVKKKIADINGLMEDQEGKGFVQMTDTLNPEKPTESEMICDFGAIPTLNEAYGGYRTGNFYQVMGPPKGGKSKWCASTCHRAMLNGYNVTVWAQEGGIEMWSAQMRAIHCDYYHNKGKSAMDVIPNLPAQREILDGTMEPSIRVLESASCLDLKTNQQYGKVEYIDRPFLLETFIDEIDTSVQSNHSKIVIIDYMQLIDTQSGRMADHEVLKQAYKKLLNYCKKKNVAILTPVQYKQEVVSAFASGGDGGDIDMRVSAGGSAEVIRTPDMTIPMWASAHELEQGISYIQPMPNRLGKVVPRIKLYIDLAHCSFVEADN